MQSGRRRAVVQRFEDAALNRGAVGQRVAERDLHLDQIGAAFDHRVEDAGRLRHGRVAGDDVRDERQPVLCLCMLERRRDS